MGWRTAPLPPDWYETRARILNRDGHRCTETLASGERCRGHATDVHHQGAPDDHSDANLRSLCDWHHKRYTSAKANAMRTRVRQTRDAEKHPGIR